MGSPPTPLSVGKPHGFIRASGPVGCLLKGTKLQSVRSPLPVAPRPPRTSGTRPSLCEGVPVLPGPPPGLFGLAEQGSP